MNKPPTTTHVDESPQAQTPTATGGTSTVPARVILVSAVGTVSFPRATTDILRDAKVVGTAGKTRPANGRAAGRKDTKRTLQKRSENCDASNLEAATATSGLGVNEVIRNVDATAQPNLKIFRPSPQTPISAKLDLFRRNMRLSRINQSVRYFSFSVSTKSSQNYWPSISTVSPRTRRHPRYQPRCLRPIRHHHPLLHHLLRFHPRHCPRQSFPPFRRPLRLRA